MAWRNWRENAWLSPKSAGAQAGQGGACGPQRFSPLAHSLLAVLGDTGHSAKPKRRKKSDNVVLNKANSSEELPNQPWAASSPASAAGTPEQAFAASEAAEPPRQQKDLAPLLRLRPYVMRHKGMVLFAFIGLALAAAAMLGLPIAVRSMVDHGFAAENPRFINVYFVVVGVLGGVLAAGSALRFYCVTWLGERVTADLRSDVFAHLTALSPSFYEQNHSAELMSRLTADATQIKAAMGAAISQLLRNLAMLLGAVAMMTYTSMRLTFLVVAAIPLIVMPLMAYGRAVRRLSRRAQDEMAEASAYASENLAAARTLQAFTFEQSVINRFRGAVERGFDAARVRTRARAGLTATAISLVFASITAILWYGAHDVLSGSMSAGQLVQFLLYAVFAAGSVAELSEVWGEAQQAAGAAERLSELIAQKPDIVSPARPVPFPAESRGEVVFENVTFHYPSRPEVHALEGVSFAVRPGERVAIVGPSGAGKSTVFSLILRFFDPQEGRVMIDRVSAKDADLRELRRRIALAPQDIALFAGSVFENIAYGVEDASGDEIERAAQMAFADGFIRELPQGYATKLGERGVSLSGGQRQRVAIARAILRDAPILLLDEATSALDSESEKLVQNALERVMENRTTLIIAHRLSTVLSADRILVLERGRIVEEGRHEDLIRAGGVYARLAELQFQTDNGAA
jgi:ATP-binding cassette subfamily B protein